VSEAATAQAEACEPTGDDDMRKFLIIALSVPSLGALTNMAYADIKPLQTPYSADQLKASCAKNGGTFGREGSNGSYYCEFKGGSFVECNKAKRCEYVTPFTAAGTKVGAKPLNGNLGSTTKLGGTSTATIGGTATGGSKVGGVTFGSTMSGGTTPAGTKGGAAGSVTAVTPVTSNPTLLSAGGALGATRPGLGAGPIAGGINGRKLQ
jgi:hypothetical protein